MFWITSSTNIGIIFHIPSMPSCYHSITSQFHKCNTTWKWIDVSKSVLKFLLPGTSFCMLASLNFMLSFIYSVYQNIIVSTFLCVLILSKLDHFFMAIELDYRLQQIQPPILNKCMTIKQVSDCDAPIKWASLRCLFNKCVSSDTYLIDAWQLTFYLIGEYLMFK